MILLFYTPSNTCANFYFGTGTFAVPVDALLDPLDYLRIRDVKQWYVNHLVDMLGREVDDHEDLTAPMLVVASVDKNQFKQKEVNKYTYQVRSCYCIKATS